MKKDEDIDANRPLSPADAFLSPYRMILGENIELFESGSFAFKCKNSDMAPLPF